MGPYPPNPPRVARRELLRWIAASPLLVPSVTAGLASATATLADERSPGNALPEAGPEAALNVRQFEELAQQRLDREIFDFIAGGADDQKTVAANRAAYDRVQILARRLVDVSDVDTSVEILGQRMETPLLLAPVGTQGNMHPSGELGTARAAAAMRHTMIASTVSTHSIAEIRQAHGGPVWFQLYPTDERSKTESLLRKAEAAGCPVCALTVDTPVIGNRESQKAYIRRILDGGGLRLGNFDDIGAPAAVDDPALTWDFIGWLRERTRMKILIKGIVTAEDAALTVRHGADGLIVSNHGGRQLESNRGTLEALPEIVAAVDGRLPVLLDGGIMRGTDIFKALALGADAICIGRAYIWGLATFGQSGVEQVLRLLRAELIRDMQLAGVQSVRELGPEAVRLS